MHPLRFPDSGIRAKVFVLRILVMFSQRRQRGGGVANPHKGSTTHGQASYKGQPATAMAPCKGAASHSQSPLQG
ncbi:hypothetical protein BHM03_00059089 [Ensete ventricosum]|nr:hypothetical protein BHM03_00059089 [Ensete ventricosum]